MYVCRHCEAEIGHLNYSQACTEYGTCDPDGDNSESDSTEGNGSDIIYECPECNVTASSPESIVRDTDDEDDEENYEGTIPDTTQASAIMEESRRNSRTRMGNYVTSPQAIQACSQCRQPIGPGMVCVCQNENN